MMLAFTVGPALREFGDRLGKDAEGVVGVVQATQPLSFSASSVLFGLGGWRLDVPRGVKKVGRTITGSLDLTYGDGEVLVPAGSVV